MNKQKNQLIGLCLFLVVCAGAYMGLKTYNEKAQEKEQQKTESETVTAVEVDNDAVTSFSYQSAGETLTFEKEDDTWYYQPDHSIPIDQNGITSMLSAVAKVTTQEKFKDVEDTAEYGFDEPLNVLQFETAEGSYTVTLGMKNEVTSQYYVRNSESDMVYLIDTDLSSTFAKTVEELTAEEEETDTDNTEENDVDSTEENSSSDESTEDSGVANDSSD